MLHALRSSDADIVWHVSAMEHTCGAHMSWHILRVLTPTLLQEADAAPMEYLHAPAAAAAQAQSVADMDVELLELMEQSSQPQVPCLLFLTAILTCMPMASARGFILKKLAAPSTGEGSLAFRLVLMVESFPLRTVICTDLDP